MTSPLERTLVLVKPDGVARHLTGEILRRIETKGYTITALQLLHPDRALLEQHYAEHAERPFFGGLVEFMGSGPVVAAVVEGHRVIEGIRTIVGATDPTVAAPGSVRGDLGHEGGGAVIENLVHASDAVESAEREISLWFAAS
ncbi:nucleoside-diphosphate kinase [Georgenia sp. Z1491]|uniref:nucleoside-diphosphate kinase n=1 Tax=Georgenia sp. Z1491 TaxID=3416707 RepID=UPI003CF29F78